MAQALRSEVHAQIERRVDRFVTDFSVSDHSQTARVEAVDHFESGRVEKPCLMAVDERGYHKAAIQFEFQRGVEGVVLPDLHQRGEAFASFGLA